MLLHIHIDVNLGKTERLSWLELSSNDLTARPKKI